MTPQLDATKSPRPRVVVDEVRYEVHLRENALTHVSAMRLGAEEESLQR
jgi:hypothetical protein